jgi:RNA polymerase sigma-70 factor (ECF subfamily)
MPVPFVGMGMSAFAASFGLELLAALGRRDVPDPYAAVPAPAETFEAVYRDHYRDVYRYVLLSLRRGDDADDVVADTFDRAFAAWRSGHGPAGRALPWLLVIARRIVVDRWRRDRLIRWLPFATGRGAQDPVDTGDEGGRAEFWLWLEELARALPTRQREVVFLRYQRDLSDEEIGEILGISASGVRTLVSRALAALRQHPELWS